jgi:hypothetical protein
MEIIKKNLWLILFTVVALFFAVWYASWVTSAGGFSYVRDRTPLGRLGRGLGFLGFLTMGLVYGRSVLKMIVRQESFWKSLEPLAPDEVLDLKKLSNWLLVVLNKTHAYLGVLSVILIFVHCWLTGSYLNNLLLQVVLILMAVEMLSGFFLKLRYSPAELKQKSFLVHRQFILGAIIIIFTLFGHLILKR